MPGPGTSRAPFTAATVNITAWGARAEAGPDGVVGRGAAAVLEKGRSMVQLIQEHKLLTVGQLEQAERQSRAAGCFLYAQPAISTGDGVSGGE